MNENQNLKVLAIDTETGKLREADFVSPVVEFLVDGETDEVISHTPYSEIDLSKYPRVVCNDRGVSIRMAVFCRLVVDGDIKSLVFSFGDFDITLYSDDTWEWKKNDK